MAKRSAESQGGGTSKSVRTNEASKVAAWPHKAVEKQHPALTLAKNGSDSFKPFFFVQMADTQLGMWDKYIHAEQDPKNEGWSSEVTHLDRVVTQINRLRPAFAVVCGDLVDEFPDKDDDRRRRQMEDYKKACSAIDESIPLVCLCGNHDVGNRPNAATVRSYTDEFGDDYFSFWVNGVKCLAVNSQLWKDSTECLEMRDEQDKWFEAELSEASKHKLVFSHIPPFIYDAAEPNGYFNFERETRQRLLSLSSKNNVCAWFCGHYHRNASGIFKPCDGESGCDVEVITTGAVGASIENAADGNPLELSGIGKLGLSDETSGVRLVSVNEASVTHAWYPVQRLEAVEASSLLQPSKL